MENEAIAPNLLVEPPRGRFPGRLDDKGRLKLPTDLQAYFATLPERKLFVTSLDRRLAQIYPISVWRANEKVMFECLEHPDAARRNGFIASDLGSEVEMDAQGRITLNPDLRRELGLENQGLHLNPSQNGKVEIMTDAIYEEEKRLAAQQKIAEDLDKLQRAGLK